jgi:hypothetical protein
MPSMNDFLRPRRPVGGLGLRGAARAGRGAGRGPAGGAPPGSARRTLASCCGWKSCSVSTRRSNHSVIPTERRARRNLIACYRRRIRESGVKNGYFSQLISTFNEPPLHE